MKCNVLSQPHITTWKAYVHWKAEKSEILCFIRSSHCTSLWCTVFFKLRLPECIFHLMDGFSVEWSATSHGKKRFRDWSHKFTFMKWCCLCYSGKNMLSLHHPVIIHVPYYHAIQSVYMQTPQVASHLVFPRARCGLYGVDVILLWCV
jgi:hypothetical protein